MKIKLLSGILYTLFLSASFFAEGLFSEEAKFYEKLLNSKVQCLLCPRECLLENGETGKCMVRKNINGKLISLVYAKPCSVNIDPVEKKPLFHFLPKSRTFSIATPGCNLRCVFCQNWSIAQVSPEKIECVNLSPEQVLDTAKSRKCPSISYTYSEPTVFYEYMYDTALIARKQGIKNILISCGYINHEPLIELCSVLDAANINLKGFHNKTYRWVAGTKIDPVLDALKTLKNRGVWLEVGYLVIPTLNDSDEEIKKFTDWVRDNLGTDTPVHFLRFFPQHKLNNLPPTPIKTMEKAYSIAKDSGIQYVYLGNVPGHKANNTYCGKCGKLLVERKGYFIGEYNIINGKCRYCKNTIPGVWK